MNHETNDRSPNNHSPAGHSTGASPESKEPVISIDDVEVHFEREGGPFDLLSKAETVHAVDGVSLDIHPKEVIALVGESGCGKTTLGKTAIGLQRPTKGNVRYRGQDIWDAKDNKGDVAITYEEIRTALQIIHQDPGSSINPNRKILANLSEPLRKTQPDLSRNDRRARILGMLETVGMTPAKGYANRYPHQLSGGEKQRVALIRALLMNPDVILADEAISALDVSLRIDMMELFLDLREEFNTAFVFISHDLSNARYLAQKANGLIGIMYLGELVEIGPAETILEDPRHPYTKALRWSTPDLYADKNDGEMPIRKIDVPDAVNPPSGCRFHTRCPKAREACVTDVPEAVRTDENTRHRAACFREYDEHEYWTSPAIKDDEEDSPQRSTTEN